MVAEIYPEEATMTERGTGDRLARALTLVQAEAGECSNDQPPGEWLVQQAALRGGLLAGFVALAGPASPWMRVDTIIVRCEQAAGLAEEIANLWPLDDGSTALDRAVVDGLDRPNTTHRRWGWPGSVFLAWRADGGSWLGATYCSFWWMSAVPDRQAQPTTARNLDEIPHYSVPGDISPVGMLLAEREADDR